MVERQSDTYLKELAQGFVVQAIGAVEYDALLGHSLGQILAGLRFASARRTFGCAAQT